VITGSGKNRTKNLVKVITINLVHKYSKLSKIVVEHNFSDLLFFKLFKEPQTSNKGGDSNVFF
jgi:hypothetical protein